MPNIQINIKNKVARADRAIIVCDNSDYTAVFDFDDEWSAYDTKTARFVCGGRYTDVVFSGNECPVPVIQDTRAVTVGVFAGDLHTTTPAYFACVPSILFGNGIPADPTPDVYNQLMELLNKDSGVWYPTVDDAGNMSWTRSISETEPQPVNIKGPKGDAGANGADGNDGISPAVSVAAITGGNRVTITDAEGAKTFDVMDGAQGASGADGKDYVLTDADKQEIAKTAAGLVDVPSVQPDWNQNDSTQPDYVKNRPFYDGIVETVLVEESTVSFAENSGFYMAQVQSTFEATVGEIYKVYWDGTVYECICVDLGKAYAIGNLSIAGAGSDTGEPFLMQVINFDRIYIGTADTSASHTFSISAFAQEVVKIDEKYLPDPPNDPYIIIKKSTSDEYSCNMTYDEIATLYAKYSDASELYDIRYNIFYDDGSRQYRCVNVWHSDNFYFAFVFCYETCFFSIMVSKYDGVLNGADTYFMGAEEFNSGYYPLIVKSSTAGSTKKFKITVDDSGTLKATEVS